MLPYRSCDAWNIKINLVLKIWTTFIYIKPINKIYHSAYLLNFCLNWYVTSTSLGLQPFSWFQSLPTIYTNYFQQAKIYCRCCWWCYRLGYCGSMLIRILAVVRRYHWSSVPVLEILCVGCMKYTFTLWSCKIYAVL